jgi:hypothetical protein
MSKRELTRVDLHTVVGAGPGDGVQIWRRDLPNQALKGRYDEAKRDNFGNSPWVYERSSHGQARYDFSMHNSATGDYPATVRTYNRAGKLLHVW